METLASFAKEHAALISAVSALAAVLSFLLALFVVINKPPAFRATPPRRFGRTRELFADIGKFLVSTVVILFGISWGLAWGGFLYEDLIGPIDTSTEKAIIVIAYLVGLALIMLGQRLFSGLWSEVARVLRDPGGRGRHARRLGD